MPYLRKLDRKRWRSERYKKRIKYAVQLLGGACAACGAKEHLEFDHIHPVTKEHKVTYLHEYSMTRFLEEVLKCQLLCTECHRIRTTEYNSTGTLLTAEEILYRSGNGGVSERDIQRGNYIDEEEDIF